MSLAAKEAKTSGLKEILLSFDGLKWWQSFLSGLIVFLFFSLITDNWLILFLLGIVIGFLSGKRILVASGITGGSLVLSWVLLYLFNTVFSSFRTLAAADAFLAIATGSSGLGLVLIVIALFLATLLGLTSGAFGAALFQEWELVKARITKE